MSTGKKSASKREQVALHLASGATVRATAAKCGVSERTVHGWLKEPDFAGLVDDLRRQMLERGMAVLMANTTRASRTLAKLLEHKNARIRLSAAKALLEQSVRMRDAVQLAKDVQELQVAEAARAERERGGR